MAAGLLTEQVPHGCCPGLGVGVTELGEPLTHTQGTRFKHHQVETLPQGSNAILANPLSYSGAWALTCWGHLFRKCSHESAQTYFILFITKESSNTNLWQNAACALPHFKQWETIGLHSLFPEIFWGASSCNVQHCLFKNYFKKKSVASFHNPFFFLLLQHEQIL